VCDNSSSRLFVDFTNLNFLSHFHQTGFDAKYVSKKLILMDIFIPQAWSASRKNVAPQYCELEYCIPVFFFCERSFELTNSSRQEET